MVYLNQLTVTMQNQENDFSKEIVDTLKIEKTLASKNEMDKRNARIADLQGEIDEIKKAQ